jgi:hypothetical protein
MLALTAGSTLFALNFITNSDHAVEFGLSALLLIVALGATLFVRKFVPLSILAIVVVGCLASSIAFLTQSTLASTHLIDNLEQFISPDNLFTAGLGATAVVSLFWLLRPFTWLNRLVLFVLFAGAAACLFIQYPFSDLNSPGGNQGDIKHTLLLITLISLIQGTLLAVRAERARAHP